MIDFCKLGLAVIETEAHAIFELTQRIDANFAKICQEIMSCTGRIVLTGMGKSGHIARKISATLASTGTPSFFMHPAEANHGDLGMLTRQDIVIAISYSGQTSELITLLPLIKRYEIPLISLTGKSDSLLARSSNYHIDVSVSKEACPLGLAPTTSTTAALVMGDALAIALLEARGFTSKDFAHAHPGGSLGRRLLLLVDDLLNKDDALPLVNEDATISEALIVVTEKKLGMTCIVDHTGCLLGIFTDGDIRRTLAQNIDIQTTPIHEVMTRNCHTIPLGLLAYDAMKIMEQYKITSLVIIDPNRIPLGVLHLHDLLRAGLI